MKFKYVPGMRPTPMLMYQKEVNINIFNEDWNSFKSGEFTTKLNHIWNMGSYIIYDDNLDVVSYRISNVHNFLWLLRVINKELTIIFKEDFIKDNQDFIKEVSEELITI